MNNNQGSNPLDWYTQNPAVFNQMPIQEQYGYYNPQNMSPNSTQYTPTQMVQPEYQSYGPAFAQPAQFQQGVEPSAGPERSRKVSRDARQGKSQVIAGPRSPSNERKISTEQARRDATRANTDILRNRLPRSYEREATSDPKVLEKAILYIDYLETELGLTQDRKNLLPAPAKTQQSSQSGSIGTSGKRRVS